MIHNRETRQVLLYASKVFAKMLSSCTTCFTDVGNSAMATGGAIDQTRRLARKCLLDDKRALRATNAGVDGNLLASVTVSVSAWRCTSVKTELAAVRSTHKDITEVAVVCLAMNCMNKHITNGKLIITA